MKSIILAPTFRQTTFTQTFTPHKILPNIHLSYPAKKEILRHPRPASASLPTPGFLRGEEKLFPSTHPTLQVRVQLQEVSLKLHGAISEQTLTITTFPLIFLPIFSFFNFTLTLPSLPPQVVVVFCRQQIVVFGGQEVVFVFRRQLSLITEPKIFPIF